MRTQVFQLLLFAPVFGHANVKEAARWAVFGADGNGYTNSDTNAKDIAAATSSSITAEIQVIDRCKVLHKVLAHSIEGNTVNESIVRHHADDAVVLPKPIRRPAKELHIDIAQRIAVSRVRVLRIGVTDPLINHVILAVLVVLVLVDLADVIGWVTDHYHDAGGLLALHALGVLLVHPYLLLGVAGVGPRVRQLQRIGEADAGERV